MLLLGFYKIGNIRALVSLFLLSVTFCVTCGCFGHSGTAYPASWPRQEFGTDCPNIEGWYEFESSSQAHELARIFADFELSGFSMDLRKPGGISERTKFVDVKSRDYYLSQLKLDDALPKLTLFRIDQAGCTSLFLSFIDSSGDFPADNSKAQMLQCLPMKISSYNKDLFSSYSQEDSHRGGASFFIGSSGNRIRLGSDVEGNLIRNDKHFTCGLVLIPPIPLCFSTSNSWRKYSKVPAQIKYPRTNCH